MLTQLQSGFISLKPMHTLFGTRFFNYWINTTFNDNGTWNSPSPGHELNGEKTWFAYGGDGFILSRPAIRHLVSQNLIQNDDEPNDLNRTELPLTERWAALVKEDCCGDSVLGFALANKGIFVSGLYPIFNAHALHGIPFGPSNKPYWC